MKAREKLIKSMLESLRCAMDCPMGFDRPMVVELIGLTKMLGVVYSVGRLDFFWSFGYISTQIP